MSRSLSATLCGLPRHCRRSGGLEDGQGEARGRRSRVAVGVGPGGVEPGAVAGGDLGVLVADVEGDGAGVDMRTLPLRFERATASAAGLAERLAQHPGVAVVRYPGRPDHPSHATARSFMSGFGAVVSFEVEGGAGRADAVCRSVRIIRHATSLGGVESTIERRAAVAGQTHLPSGLLRLSVGCEHPDDLWRDLQQALTP
jgi:cystathionine gamma-synthase